MRLTVALFLMLFSPSVAFAYPAISGIWLALAGNQGSVGRIASGAGLNHQELLAIREPFVTGAYMSDTWRDIEPAPGVFNFAHLDRAVAQVAAAGKKVRIGIRSGDNSPPWLFREVPTYTTINPVNAGRCHMMRIPMPFNAIYLQRFGAMTTALAAHYRNNPAVIGVTMGGITRTTVEVWAPGEMGQSIQGCRTQNDVANLQKFGWTEDGIIAAWRTMTMDYARDFPTQYVTLSGCGESPIPNNSMPAIGPNGSYDPSAVDICSAHFLPLSKAILGDRFTALNASWQVGSFNGITGINYHGIGAINDFGIRTGTITGFQTSRVLASDDSRCMPDCDPSTTLAEMTSELEHYSQARYIEAMSDDLVNPRLAPQWEALRVWLQSH